MIHLNEQKSPLYMSRRLDPTKFHTGDGAQSKSEGNTAWVHENTLKHISSK